jgi:hypothetical protein
MSSHTSRDAESSMRSEGLKVDRIEARNSSRMHEWLEAIRDTAIMVAFQMILRATLMMRRWNY